MVKKIALEEHFLDPATEPYWRPTMVDVAPAKTAQLYASLTDFGERRLQMMDKAGIARAVLAIAGPGVQVERDTATAVRKAKASNDFLAREVQKRPDRYSGFAHLAMQDPKAAADELERSLRELKFCGAMIDGHTNGKYLDDRSYDPFWERAAALGAPVYLHPADPVAPLPVLAGHNVLARPMWGWGVETGSHALRIICGGVFHRYPKAKLVLGHLGETLPFQLWRFDSRSAPYGWNSAEAAVAIPQGERLGDDVGHVRSAARALLARCARPRPRDVLLRLSVRTRRALPSSWMQWRSRNPYAPTSPTTTRRGCWGWLKREATYAVVPANGSARSAAR